jgi:hypothetical protein
MSFSLPADPPTARSLTAIVPQLLASLTGDGDWFAARSAILVLSTVSAAATSPPGPDTPGF